MALRHGPAERQTESFARSGWAAFPRSVQRVASLGPSGPRIRCPRLPAHGSLIRYSPQASSADSRCVNPSSSRTR